MHCHPARSAPDWEEQSPPNPVAPKTAGQPEPGPALSARHLGVRRLPRDAALRRQARNLSEPRRSQNAQRPKEPGTVPKPPHHGIQQSPIRPELEIVDQDPPAAPHPTGLGYQSKNTPVTRHPVSEKTAQHPGNLNSSAEEKLRIPVSKFGSIIGPKIYLTRQKNTVQINAVQFLRSVRPIKPLPTITPTRESNDE
jgi:hypothetical protein